MKLWSVQIHRFRAIEDLTIRFDDAFGRVRPVTVLAGPNGCGKTSVLFAIVQTLRGVMGYRTSDVPEPSNLDIHRSGALGGLSKFPASISVRLELEYDDVEKSAMPKLFVDTFELHKETLQTLPQSRVTAQWNYPPERNPDGSRRPSWWLNIHPREALQWFHGRRYAIQGWRKRMTTRSVLDQVGGIYLFPQDRNLQSRVVGSANGILDGSEMESDSEANGQYVRTSEPPSVWGILEYLSSYSLNRRIPLEAEENWENRVKEQFARICGPKEYLGFLYQPDDPVGAPHFKDGESWYPLNMAASGEQVIIEYITRLTYPSPWNRSVILIDEPEVHLHPAWIRQLYAALPKIGSDNQYILTTHSPELRALAAEDNCLIDLGEMTA